MCGGQQHEREGSPAWPQGQGFIAKVPLTLEAPAPRPGYPKQIKHLGDEIRARRLDLGLLQCELAERIGVSKESVTNRVLGRTTPREDLWGRLWRELGL